MTREMAITSSALLDGMDTVSGQPTWRTESPRIHWQPVWQELDLVIGLAVERSGISTLLDPSTYATQPREGIQLPGVSVLGSDQGERIFAGVQSLVDGAGGSDELFNTESQGTNLLIGGPGADRFFLTPIHDQVIGGSLFGGAAAFGLPESTALVDGERDLFLIDAGGPAGGEALQILDFEPQIDVLLLDGMPLQGEWSALRQQLQSLNVALNAAPRLGEEAITVSLEPGVEGSEDLSRFATDADGDALQLLKVRGPDWIHTTGTTLHWSPPTELSTQLLDALDVLLAFSDGKSVSTAVPRLSLAPPPVLSITALSSELAEGNSGTTTFTFLVNRQGSTSQPSSSRWSVSSTGASPADRADFLGAEWPSGTVFFSPGQTSQTIAISVAADREREADEVFTVSLSEAVGADLDGARASALARIVNDDIPDPSPPPDPEPTQPPALSIEPKTAVRAEEEAGTIGLSFTVYRRGDTSGTSEVDWRVRGDGPSPADGNDFSNGLPASRLRFAPGETRRDLTVLVRADRLQEADETFVVEIHNARGARIEAATARGSILNDDRIGSGGRNRLVGTNLPEFFDGRGGRSDRLTGGGGADVFGFHFGHSKIGTPDRITDFRFGEDKIDLFRGNGRDLAAPKRFSRAADNGKARTLTALAKAMGADADGRAPGKQRLQANSATLIRATRPEIKGTYLLINDSNPGLDLNRDLLVDISGFDGRLPRLGSLRVDSVFA